MGCHSLVSVTDLSEWIPGPRVQMTKGVIRGACEIQGTSYNTVLLVKCVDVSNFNTFVPATAFSHRAES
jgi:hypothetical protein